MKRKLMGTLPTFVYIALIMIPAFYEAIFEFEGNILLVMGRAFALFAVSVFSLQVVLSARIKWLDRIFGLDRLLRFHKKMAIVALFVAIAHPPLVAIGHDYIELLTTIDTSLPVLVGRITLLFILFAVGLALWFHKLKIDYRTWHLFHKGAILIILLAAFHGYALGYNLEDGFLRYYMGGLISIGILTFLWRNIVYPLRRRPFVVTSNEQETRDTHTLTLKPEGKPIDFIPGQFAFLKLYGKKAEEHPFTIAGKGENGELLFTIKESGDFTDRIADYGEGTKAKIDAPYGRFHIKRWDAPRFVFIAGGVGITPIMSMLRHLRDTEDSRQRRLIYANKTTDDIIFRDELEQMNIPITHLLSRQENIPEDSGDIRYLKGRISEKVIEDTGNCHFFICGPVPMMDATIGILERMNIPKSRIHYEKFTLNK